MTSALILGGADCWLEDEKRARQLFTPDLIIACNHAGRDYPGQVDHWATLHLELFPGWIATRRANGLPDAKTLWVRSDKGPVLGFETMRAQTWGGSSGLFCVAVGTHLGLAPMVLCGIPLRPERAHFDTPKKRWVEATQYRPGWIRHLHQMKGKVKSMSGWTGELLGQPTQEWIDSFKGESNGKQPVTE